LVRDWGEEGDVEFYCAVPEAYQAGVIY